MSLSLSTLVEADGALDTRYMHWVGFGGVEEGAIHALVGFLEVQVKEGGSE